MFRPKFRSFLGQDESPLDNLAQLAHISRPCVLLKSPRRLRRENLGRNMCFLAEKI
jgi:hypothetical protein